MTRILVTGGAGFIGSHTCKQLAAVGFTPIVFDDLSAGFAHNVRWGPHVRGSLLDRDALSHAFKAYSPAAVIHLAAVANVGESMVNPEKYYEINVVGTMNLLDAMKGADVEKIVFSSSCHIYGSAERLPITEETLKQPVSPYGSSKLCSELMLDGFAAAYGLRFAALRYFNASGADPDGELFEEHEPETHLIPIALQVAAGIRPSLTILGCDYETPDGTGIRDYVHVSDLAWAHVAALRWIEARSDPLRVNLGAGVGVSVRDVIAAIRRVTGRDLSVSLGARRAGDPPVLYADITRARATIGFDPQHSGLDRIVETAWARYAPAAHLRRPLS